MKLLVKSAALLLIVLFINVPNLFAQDEDIYDEGTVWNITFVKTGANKSEKYLKDLATTWVSTMDEAKKQGLILSYKMLQGDAANQNDFNIVLMTEYKSLADFDPNKQIEAKWDAIEKNVKDKVGAAAYQTTVDNYDQIRNIVGNKRMREIHLK